MPEPSTHTDQPDRAGILLNHADLTVGDVVRRCFPQGTAIKLEPGSRLLELCRPNDNRCTEAPIFPPDLFAVCGLLLNLSGAVHHIGTEKKLPRSHPAQKTVALPEEAMASTKRVAKSWTDIAFISENVEIPERVSELWKKLMTHFGEPVFRLVPRNGMVPAWWILALELLVIADEASISLGFQGSEATRSNLWRIYEGYLTAVESASIAEERAEEREEGNDTSASNEEKGETAAEHGYIDQELVEEREAAERESIDEKRAEERKESNKAPAGNEGNDAPFTGRYTLSTISPDILCVLPKSRTAQIGCTLRSLSHHLALVPPRGLARAYWVAPPSELFKLREDTDPLNLLLVPFPYDLPASSFEPIASFGDDPHHRWGWFGIKPKWEPNQPEDHEKIVSHICKLAEYGNKRAGPIHGIVFPELSITFRTFRHLRKRIEKAVSDNDPLSSIELLVAGLRTNERGLDGNYAAACVFSLPVKKRDDKESTRYFVLHAQSKHHRWRIDAKQVAAYGIGSSLTSGVIWWEDIPLLDRRICSFVFRRGSTFVPLICEDLARLEPVHDLVRSIGPTIVFALLMDGPQILGRWPARYAMGLADDPGSSVLTLTSLGIVKRALAHTPPGLAPTISIGLWRDETGDTREIVVDESTCAVILSLSGQRVNEYTVDGRSDGFTARRWVYADHICLNHECEFISGGAK